MSGQVAKKQPARPGKQCKILVRDKLLAKKRTKPKSVKTVSEANPNLQAQLMTDEQYMKLIEKVKKSLPNVDIEKDCPSNTKTKKKKKSKLKNLFN